jgi:regulator of nonsense transcripts 3
MAVVGPGTMNANGVLPMPTAIMQRNFGGNKGKRDAKSPPRKLIVRRLPPGLTEDEFKNAIGDEWQLGSGKIDHFHFRPGKIATNPSKYSKPAWATIRVTEDALVPAFIEKISQTVFHDAKNSFNDRCLIGKPVAEIDMFQKTSNPRQKPDPRQGTIDQDPEFQAFLVGQTQEPPKSISIEGAENIAPTEDKKVTTTPLIEYLREKKAAKEKGTSKPKHIRIESKDEKPDRSEKKASKAPLKDITSAGDKGKRANRSEKAAKEAIKTSNKEVSATTANSSTQAVTESNAPTSTTEKKPGRVNASAAAKLLQRDLGIGPAAGSRRRGVKRELATDASKALETKPAETTSTAAPEQGEKVPSEVTKPPKKENHRPSRAERRAHKAALEKATADTQNATGKESAKHHTTPTTVPSSILRKPATPATAATTSQGVTTSSGTVKSPPPTAPKGPAGNRRASNTPAQTQLQSNTIPKGPAATTSSDKLPAPKPAAPAPTSRQAFLKHANPSQGITEPLIEAALSVYGAIEKVEIDKRKGFAYVDFVEPEGLQKAIAASPVKVAQGAVQVLERKERLAGKLTAPSTASAAQTLPTSAPTAPRGGVFRGPRGGNRGRGGGSAGRGRGVVDNAQQANNTSRAPPSHGTITIASAKNPDSQTDHPKSEGVTPAVPSSDATSSIPEQSPAPASVTTVEET